MTAIEAKWGQPHKEQKTELRGLISVAPGGLLRSAEIQITGHGGRSFSYLVTAPRGRSAKGYGLATLAEAKAESDRVARALLALFAEPVEGGEPR